MRVPERGFYAPLLHYMHLYTIGLILITILWLCMLLSHLTTRKTELDNEFWVVISVEEDICGESVILALYTVRYLLGGSEKDVRETYISCTQSGEAEARKVCPRDLFTVPVSEVSI